MMGLAFSAATAARTLQIQMVMAATTVAGMRVAWNSLSRRRMTSGDAGKKRRNPIIVLAGPTAVGKSSLALKLCDELGGEIVSADSVQLYRGMDIGSNKPSAKIVRSVRHHLVDVGDPDDPWTAGRWSRSALAAIDDCLSRDRVPVVVGGTMMYVRWLTRGAPDAPKATAETAAKAELMTREYRDGGRWEEALEVLKAMSERGSVKAASLSANDWYRLVRAVEIELDDGVVEAEAAPKFLADEKYDVRCFFLAPRDRVELFRIIDERCKLMLERGLLAEIADLVATSRLPSTSTAARAIGYRQGLSYFDRRLKEERILSDVDDDSEKRKHLALEAYLEMTKDFATASRNYASDQIKWYRRDKNFGIVYADDDADKVVVECIAMNQSEYREWLTCDDQQAARKNLSDVDKKAMRRYASDDHPGKLLEKHLAIADDAYERVRGMSADLKPNIFTNDPGDTTNRLDALRKTDDDDKNDSHSATERSR